MNKKNRLHKTVSSLVKKNQKEYTNPEIQRNIQNYGVYIDNILIKNRLEWVYPDQKIGIGHWPKRKSGNFDEIKILEETKEFLLIFKPYNLVVQPGAGHQKDNLTAWLIENYPEQQEIVNQAEKLGKKSNAKITAGLVHRLDKDTQGLILIAKSLDDLDYFQNQFRNRETKKKYLAIVDGLVEKNYHIKNWQARDRQNPIKQKLFWTEQEAFDYDEKSRFAESIIKPKVVCEETNQTLIEIQIKTGRMHQIRIQCEAIGFPLSNDTVYNNTDIKTQNCEAYYGAEPPKKLRKEGFQNFQKNIFNEADYCLLSNYIKIQTRSGKWLEAEYFDYKNQIR